MNSILHLKPLAELFFAEVEGLKCLIQQLEEENTKLKCENKGLISTLIKYEYELEKYTNWMSAGGASPPCPDDSRGASNSNASCEATSEEPEKQEEHIQQGPAGEQEATEKPKRNRKDYMREYQRQYRKTKREQQTPPVEMTA